MNPPTPTLAPAQPTRGLGWLLAVPALLGTLITLVLPTIQTIGMSLQSGGFITPSKFVGMDNYGKLLGDPVFWRALGFTLSLVVMPLLVSVVVAPLLALALAKAGGWPRRAAMSVLMLALVVFSPVAVAASWFKGVLPEATGMVTLVQGFRDVASAPGALRLVVAAATFGAVCAIAVMAFLPALRGDTPAVAALAVAGLVALAAVAVGLQAFALSYTLTQGGPSRSTTTLALLQYQVAFQQAQLGYGAAVATVTGVILGVLGVAAAILVAAGRMRITLDAARSAPNLVLGIVALIVVIALVVVTSLPALSATFGAGGLAVGLRVQINTWLPALVGAVVSVGVAYLGALGIGGLRPLGRGSEWLLLAFAPWMFAGAGPLSIAVWQDLRDLSLLDTLPALIPPLLVSVPSLVVLTLLCKGLAERNERDFARGVLVPSLPMAGILVGAVTLMNAHELLWPLLAAQEERMATAPVEVVRQLSSYRPPEGELGTTPLALVVVTALVAVAAQVFYLDRLKITVGAAK